MAPYTERYTPADTNGGWGFAGFVVALAVALIVAVTMIHKASYRHPTDVTWHAKGSSAPEGVGTLGH